MRLELSEAVLQESSVLETALQSAHRRQVQSKLVQRIDSARKLSEPDELKESVRAQRLIELRTLISRLRSVPSVATQLRILEAGVVQRRGSVETSVKRVP